jgi:hypothetical protein
MSGCQVKVVPLLVAFLLLMLFSGTLKHLEPKLFFSLMFCSRTLLLLNIIVLNIIVCVYTVYIFFSHRIMTGAIALTRHILLSKMPCFVSPFFF